MFETAKKCASVILSLPSALQAVASKLDALYGNVGAVINAIDASRVSEEAVKESVRAKLYHDLAKIDIPQAYKEPLKAMFESATR